MDENWLMIMMQFNLEDVCKMGVPGHNLDIQNMAPGVPVQPQNKFIQ
jgi:hypothetical protein